MKERILCPLKNIFFVIIIALLGTACGDDKEESINVGNEGGNGTVLGTVAKVDVKKAGSLSSLIGDDVKFNITDLTVTGNINGDDIALIREMAGEDVNGDETKGHLSKLNLKDANIVAGGNPYYIVSTMEVCYSKRDVVGAYMFRNCKLTDVILPVNATEIGNNVFQHNRADKYENTVLTTVVMGDKITIIGSSAFSGCVNLTNIVIPNNVNHIGSSAFSGCVNLTNIVIPDKVNYIDDSAFSDCVSLTKVIIPAMVVSIADNAFRGCRIEEFIVSENNFFYSSLDGVLFDKDKSTLLMYPIAKPNSSYIIPNSVTTIKSLAFKDCKLTSITIGDKITDITDAGFNNYLVEYNVSEGNDRYSSMEGVLYNKKKTELIAYPKGKTNSNYTVPSSVTIIKKSVYFNSNLTTINLNNVTGIEAYPFSGGYIREFIVPVANPSYSVENGVLFNKKQTVLIAYPMGLMKDYEPNGQGSNYVIPNGVETIRAYAFYPILEMVTVDGTIRLKGYPLENLTIPASVQDIGLFAIYGALNIHCKGETPPRLLSYYSGELVGRNIYVPMNAVNAYKQAVGWREANIIGE